MSTFKMDNMLVFKNWKLLLKVGLSEVFTLIILGAMVLNRSTKAGPSIALLVLFLAVYPAYVLSFAQKEFLNGSFTWTVPRLLPPAFPK